MDTENDRNIYAINQVAGGYDLLRDVPEAVLDEYGINILGATSPQGMILEAGFGTGRLLARLAFQNRVSGHPLVAVDSSAAMADLAKQKLVAAGLDRSVEVVTQDLVEYLEGHRGQFDLVHFKAILHCFPEPVLVLDKITSSLKSGGKIVTGHEESQVEARIEGLLRPYPAADDQDLEMILKHYFELRRIMGKEFMPRLFPAGDSQNAVAYLQAKGYVVEKVSDDQTMNFTRQFRLADLLAAIGGGTFGVFRDGLVTAERETLYRQLLEFCHSHNIDRERVRAVPARWRQYVLVSAL